MQSIDETLAETEEEGIGKLIGEDGEFKDLKESVKRPFLSHLHKCHVLYVMGSALPQRSDVQGEKIKLVQFTKEHEVSCGRPIYSVTMR